MSLPRPAAKTFQDLVVWRKAHEFVLTIYPFTADFPRPETYGLAQQLRRAAVSIPANIAEGFRRRGKADKARFMNIAEGSIEECRYYLILAKDLNYGDTGRLNILRNSSGGSIAAGCRYSAEAWRSSVRMPTTALRIA
jgi:four helix bundle protein